MFGEFQALDEEVKELLQNYRHKRATAYEPCTLTNFKECLVGLHEVSCKFHCSHCVLFQNNRLFFYCLGVRLTQH